MSNNADTTFLEAGKSVSTQTHNSYAARKVGQEEQQSDCKGKNIYLSPESRNCTGTRLTAHTIMTNYHLHLLSLCTIQTEKCKDKAVLQILDP
jgi:hypothetical protein